MPLWPRADTAVIAASRFAPCRHVRHYVDGVGVPIERLIGHSHAQPERSFRWGEIGAEQAGFAAIHRLPCLIADPEFGLRDRDGAPNRSPDLAADDFLCRMRRHREPTVRWRRNHHEWP